MHNYISYTYSVLSSCACNVNITHNVIRCALNWQISAMLLYLYERRVDKIDGTGCTQARYMHSYT